MVCNLCAKAVMSLPLTLKRDVLFSWVDIRDVAQAIKYLFEYEVSRHDYNMALPASYKLSELANIIQDIVGFKDAVKFENDGLNNEYTCNTEHLSEDFKLETTLICKSLNNILAYFQSNKDSIIIDDIDNRWK